MATSPPKSRWGKWLKFLTGLALLPLCVGLTIAFGRVLRASGGADLMWVPFLSGFLCWVVIYALLPKPMLLYVFGHELTHALWTWVFGGTVSRFKVTAKGGHVVVTRANFLITLAPYFFPLYALMVAAVFATGHAIWGWSGYFWLLDFLLGVAYSFHITMTRHILQTTQTDITENGWLFSFVVILLGNLAILLAGVPLLTSRVSLLRVTRWMWEDTAACYHWVAAGIQLLARRLF